MSSIRGTVSRSALIVGLATAASVVVVAIILASQMRPRQGEVVSSLLTQLQARGLPPVVLDRVERVASRSDLGRAVSSDLAERRLPVVFVSVLVAAMVSGAVTTAVTTLAFPENRAREPDVADRSSVGPSSAPE